MAKKPRKEDVVLSQDHFNNYGSSSFYVTSGIYEDDKAKIKFIKTLERYIRQSIEYRNFIKYLKTDAHLNYCSIMSNLGQDVIDNVTIEIHHVIYTLFDIVETVLEKYLKNNKPFTMLTLCNEVMELHYSLKISFCPLTKTSHELIHTNSVLIDPSHIFGDYNHFQEEYEIYIPDDARARASIFLNKISNTALIKETNSHMFSINSSLLELGNNTDETFEDDEISLDDDDTPPFDI